MTNIVELKNLTVNYKPNKEVDKQLIHGIDINFRKGHITGVVGESGSGKSILMRSIMSILPNNIFDKNDKFNFDGKEVKKGEKLPISMIFQNPMTSLDPVRTIGFHLIEVIERFQNKSKEEAKKLAIEQLEKVGILNAPLRMEQYPHELSGGMRQRILIAMALIANPKLLVADEPTTALDVTVQAQILSLIKKLQKETELSVALVSHDFGVIAGMCDYVYIMYRGRVVEKGNVEEIFSNAQHPYTKQLLAAARLENTNKELLTVDYKEDAKKLAIEQLEKVGILNAPLRMEQYPHELSGGMRQRILIAMALLANPKLLVADEPTTALDVTVQAQILSLIKKLQKETELSVALVSHDFGVIAGMCDYVYIMYRGRVVEKGNVEEIFSNAQHPYTKQLLAAARLENTNNELLTVDYKEDDKHYTWQKLSDTHEYLKEVE